MLMTLPTSGERERDVYAVPCVLTTVFYVRVRHSLDSSCMYVLA